MQKFLLSTSVLANVHTPQNLHLFLFFLFKETDLQTRNKQGLTSLKAGDSLDHSGFLYLKKKCLKSLFCRQGLTLQDYMCHTKHWKPDLTLGKAKQTKSLKVWSEKLMDF